tara:strand:- start:314 stop:748 length:435 start_codon:yes stop_codon:yes gene_type:complete
MKICAILLASCIAVQASAADDVPVRPERLVRPITIIDRIENAEHVRQAELRQFVSASYSELIARVFVSIDVKLFEKCELRDVFLAVHDTNGRLLTDSYVDMRDGKFSFGINRELLNDATVALHCSSITEPNTYVIQLRDVEYAP